MKSFTLAAILIAATTSVSAQTPEAPLIIPKAALPSPNGWDFINQAVKAKKTGPGGSPWNYKLDAEPPSDLALMRAYVGKNDEVFRLLREGFQHASFRIPNRLPFDAGDFPVGNARLREIGRLLKQKSRVAFADKNLDEAANSALDAVQLGILTARGGVVIDALTGIAIESIGRGELKALAPHLSAAQLREVTQRLASIETQRVWYADTLVEEKWSGVAYIQELLSQPEWRKFRSNAVFDKVMKAAFEWDDKTVILMKKTSDRQIQLNFTKAMDVAIAGARLPFAQHIEPKTPSGDPFSALMFSNAGKKIFRVSFERAATQNRLLLTQLALQAYRAETGAFPNDLQALTPKYVPNAPFDPFAPDKPLHYRRDGAAYLLYSIGPDGVDDNGTPIDNKPPLVEAITESTRRQILAGSTGDVLAEALK